MAFKWEVIGNKAHATLVINQSAYSQGQMGSSKARESRKAPDGKTNWASKISGFFGLQIFVINPKSYPKLTASNLYPIEYILS